MIPWLLAAWAVAGPWDEYAPEMQGAWVSLSPDGEHLAWLDADEEPHRIVVAPATDEAASRVVAVAPPDERLGAPAWAGPDQLVAQLGATWWVYEVDDGERWPVGDGAIDGVLPGALLVRSEAGRVLSRVDLRTRERTVLGSSRRSFDRWLVDATGTPRAGLDLTWRQVVAEDGAPYRFLTRWRLVRLGDDAVLAEGGRQDGYPNDGSWWLARLGVFGDAVIAVDGRSGRDTDAVVRLDLRTGGAEVLFESPGPDVGGALVSADGQLLAVAVHGARVRWRAVDDAVAADLERLDTLGVDYLVQSQPEASRWLLRAWTSDSAVRQLVYDRGTGEVWRVGPRWGAFEDRPWRPKEALELSARDGLPLTAYLTLPEGDGPHPLIVCVHGGPWPARDRWTFDPAVQRYAARGYAVLQVNFRGSDGLGNAFQEAWRGEWGGAMQADLFDALDHVLASGRIDPRRIAFVGESYGGYAALAAVTGEPERMACAISVSGPAVLWARTLRPHDIGFYGSLGPRALRRDRSPAAHVDRLRVPVLQVHGERDRAVHVRNALPFAEAGARLGKDVTFALLPKQGHGGWSDASTVAYLALTDAFLARCLGGAEPEGLDAALAGAGVEVRYGGGWIGD